MSTKTLVTLLVSLSLAGVVDAGPASGAFTLKKGTSISPTHATAYIVRDQRDARKKQVEILLSDVAVDAADLQAALDPHMKAINHAALKDKNYILLWVSTDGAVTMNATYGASMKQFINDTTDGLTATLTTNTPTKIDGRVTSAPIAAMGGETYTVDLTFSVDVPSASSGQPLPAGGGDAGKAFLALLAAAQKKNWAAIKAASAPAMLKIFEEDYRSEAENATYALDMLKAWVPMTKTKVGAGELRGDVAVLDVEGEMFPGMRGLTLVRMVKSGATWQVDQVQRAGFLP